MLQFTIYPCSIIVLHLGARVRALCIDNLVGACASVDLQMAQRRMCSPFGIIIDARARHLLICVLALGGMCSPEMTTAHTSVWGDMCLNYTERWRWAGFWPVIRLAHGDGDLQQQQRGLTSQISRRKTNIEKHLE